MIKKRIKQLTSKFDQYNIDGYNNNEENVLQAKNSKLEEDVEKEIAAKKVAVKESIDKAKQVRYSKMLRGGLDLRQVERWR